MRWWTPKKTRSRNAYWISLNENDGKLVRGKWHDEASFSLSMPVVVRVLSKIFSEESKMTYQLSNEGCGDNKFENNIYGVHKSIQIIEFLDGDYVNWHLSWKAIWRSKRWPVLWLSKMLLEKFVFLCFFVAIHDNSFFFFFRPIDIGGESLKVSVHFSLCQIQKFLFITSLLALPNISFLFVAISSVSKKKFCKTTINGGMEF